ncbi:hypothetical protein DM860_001297 [Cuscuta australis]|uniref:C2H2-type domain-containing protein n=1 Tax=Cuscuta australis TaxID=267555 RepID=A0A328DTB0_9ASTE|nr:hypothetical protein DM860_001297 [Cuscuta australis]
MNHTKKQATMEDNHRCKLCSREFSNGKSLRGHMRSHVMINLPPAETEDSMVLQDDGAEEEPPPPPPRRFRRSKRRRLTKPRVISGFLAMGAAGYSSPVSSSVTDSSPEEDGAHCLILLSRDHWTNRGEDEGQKGKFRCESCGRVFGSYQALGGHRASHKKKKKKKKMLLVKGKIGNSGDDHQETIENAHECPLCGRVFSSGQALGGHKRSYFSGGGILDISASATSSSTAMDVAEEDQRVPRTSAGIFIVDLNLPAPHDDDVSW